MKLLLTLLPLVILAIALRQFSKYRRTAYGHDVDSRNADRVAVVGFSALAVIVAAALVFIK